MKDKVIVTFKLETNVSLKDGSIVELCNSQVFDEITKTKAYKKHIEAGGIYVFDSSNGQTDIEIRRMISSEIFEGPEYVNAIINGNANVYNILGVVKKIDITAETVDVEIPIDRLEEINAYLDKIPSKEVWCHGKIVSALYHKGYYIEDNKCNLYIDDDCYIPYMRFC